MPSQLEELVEFLHHGNTQIRQVAAENLVGYSSPPHPISLFTSNDYEPVKDLRFLVRDYAPIAANAGTMLVNLTGRSDGGGEIITQLVEAKVDKSRGEVVDGVKEGDYWVETVLLRRIGNVKDSNADLWCMLLANLVKDPVLVKRLVAAETLTPPKPQTIGDKHGKDHAVQTSTSKRVLDQLMDLFVKGGETGSLNPNAHFDYLAYVFADISGTKEGREYFLQQQEYDSVVPITKMTVFTECNSTVRRKGVASVIKNVCFEIDQHPVLLASSDVVAGGVGVDRQGLDLLPYVLLPLAGNEEYPDTDIDDMLPDLQLLPPDKKRDDDHEIIVTHLETLLLLTTTREGREFMRKVKVYPIVRECHLHVDSEAVREACDRLVQVLMRDEASNEDGEDTTASKKTEDRVTELEDDDEDDDHKMEEIF